MARSFIRKAETNVVAASSFLITGMESCSTAQTSLMAFSDTARPAGTLSDNLSTGHGYCSVKPGLSHESAYRSSSCTEDRAVPV